MQISTQEWGPVDLAVVLFDNPEFNGDIAPALIDLHASGTVQLLDLALVRRDGDEVTVIEIEDSPIADSFEGLTGDAVDLLNDVDLAEVGAGLEPGSAALVLVWQNSWAARLSTALRESGGQVIVQERIPAETVAAAVAALEDD
ncbi:DUF6325 family protein [Nocardioides sambongensis]|uniref:DUF6325 family protein n=1 Tax=Nocardioides sambongensis TaxID=2589074 RepID=UPI00112C5E80|nr:DUF6325 family protein [Nocardioides sambongensis]